jgi:hypothetical protein
MDMEARKAQTVPYNHNKRFTGPKMHIGIIDTAM